MTLSDALKWAWGDELPKVPSGMDAAPAGLAAASAWASILRYGEVGTIVDRQPNRYGCIPFDQAGFPHRDALAIADAVSALAECAVDVPNGWHPMPELVAIDEPLASRALSDAFERATVRDGADIRRFRSRPDHLVVRHAILGIVPDWRLAHRPVKEFEAWPNGRARWFVRREVRTVIGEHADGSDRIDVVNTEVDGWSDRLQRPVAGAYRKARFSPDPVPVMVARAEYEIFCAAMAMLFEDLAPRLESVTLMAEEWPACPWSDSREGARARRGPRILPDLTQPVRPNPARKSPVNSKIKTKAKRVRKRA